MLILRRKQGERIVIGQDIELVVAEIRSGRVKLAIAAPRGVAIRRTELQPRGRRLAPLVSGGLGEPARHPDGGAQR